MSARLRIVVDTNIVVSALIAGGAPQKIIAAWNANLFHVVMSEELRSEINTVFKRSRLIRNIQKKQTFLGKLFNRSLTIKPSTIDKVIFSDEKDHFLLELAVAGKASVIVTGDKELQKVKKVRGIMILDPQQFCRRFKL